MSAYIPKNSTKTALFSVYFHRQLVCMGIAGALALRFKRRYPAAIVKFSGLEVCHD